MKNFNANTIENAIGYHFSNKDLLKQAFTRKSYTVEMDQGENNEVLEFLGDKVLDLIVTKKLIEPIELIQLYQTIKLILKYFVSSNTIWKKLRKNTKHHLMIQLIMK